MDFYQDHSKTQLFDILRDLQNDGMEIPDFVLTKTASDSDVGSLRPGAFALPSDRAFPLHTKADTWLSCAYAAQGRHGLRKNAKERVKSMLEKGASFWNIPLSDLARMDRVLGPRLQKQASEDSETVGTVDEFNVYVDKALGRFPEMEQPVRLTLSERLLKTADEQGWELSPERRYRLEQSACLGSGLRKEVLVYLYDVRQSLPKTADEACSILDACMTDIERDETADPDKLRKTAGLVDLVLRTRPSYANGAVLPETHLFTVTPCLHKFASEQLVALPGGHVLTKTAIEAALPALASELHARTGSLPMSVDETVAILRDMSPVTVDSILEVL